MTKKKKQAKKAGPYLRRTFEDERVHAHIANAAASLHKAYDRFSRRGGAAVEDKKFYDQIRESAGSMRAAVVAVRKPPPKPKRRGRKLLIVIVLATAGVVIAKKRGSSSAEPRDTSDRAPEPVEPGRPAMASQPAADAA